MEKALKTSLTEKDAVKFRKGLKEIGIGDDDIKCYHDFSYDDFGRLFQELHAQVNANA